jgi:hypothetical protein
VDTVAAVATVVAASSPLKNSRGGDENSVAGPENPSHSGRDTLFQRTGWRIL